MWSSLPLYMDFSLGHVSPRLSLNFSVELRVINRYTVIVASLLGPMSASLAEEESEIGARMGVCFTFTGSYCRSIS